MYFQIKGIHHVEFTVTNLQRSKEFYQKLPGFKLVAEYVHFIMFSCADFYLGLTDHALASTTIRFDEKHTGLDHLAFTVSSEKDLINAIDFFNAENIPTGKIKELSNGTKVLSFRDPDNIQLELAFKNQ